MTNAVDAQAVHRWAESIAGVARTGLAFSDVPYERERYEELLHIAGDMLATVSEGVTQEEHVAAWLASVANGVFGYVTPKVGVGAFVGNDKGELLLIKRSDTHRWFFPTGWADIGYSASEVAVKEVREECGLDVDPVQLISVYDGMRAGSPIPHYTMVFLCRLIGGELSPNPMECEDIGWFAQDSLPQPLFWGDFWRDQAFAALGGEISRTHFDQPRAAVWRTMPG